MNRVRGRRYDDAPRKLNMKKVIATIIAFIVIIMVILSLKRLLTKEEKTHDVSSLMTYISVVENNKWGVIDNKGNVVIDLTYDEMIIVPDRNEDVFICTQNVDYNNETYETKVIDSTGKSILTEYNNVEPIENNDGSNIWYEENILRFKENGKYGLINFEGKKMIEAEYDNIHALQGIKDSLVIEQNGKKGIINNKTSEVVVKPEYTEIEALSETQEGYIVKNDAGKYGLIAKDTSTVLDFKYDDIKNISSNNYYVVIENGVQEVVTTNGKVVLTSGFDSVEGIKANDFIIIKNGKYGVINDKGEQIIKPEYEDVKFGTVDSFVAQKDGKVGIIKKDGTVAVDFKYQRINYIESADFFQAEKDNYKTDVITREFNVALEDVIISEMNIEDGYLRVRVGEDYKYYNCKLEEKTSKEVLTTNTLFLVKENGKYGYENKNGERVVDCIYDDAKEQNEFGYCAVKKDGLWGALKSDGTVIVTPSKNLDDYLYVDFISQWNRYNDLRINIYTK